jgi:hypothetical protein
MENTKIISIMLLALIALTMLFGCTNPEPVTDGNTVKVTNQAEANKTLNDASTDLSGVKSTLDDVENSLTD